MGGMKVHAFAAMKAGDALRPFSYEVSSLQPFEVLIKVSHCGLCHSDIHLIDNDWGRSQYPLVPGHEIIGTIVKKGEQVDHLKVGERVGVSWIHNACMQCPTCLEGDTNICPEKTAICNGHYGGFADHLVADGRFAFPIPKTLESAYAAPLMCAGATVYGPLHRYHVAGPHAVGVLGVGGLGHLALQFAAALGCEVSALSHSASKEAEAKAFGAHHFYTAKKPPKPNSFDFILSTISADLDWNLVLSYLKPKGTLCFLGRPLNLIPIDTSPLISFQKTIAGSSTANRAAIHEMLAFAARHKIRPQIELMPLKEVNKGIERVKNNAARYRVVLEV
jgi:uncharacterized zinc-type alcohol dehydrogenase-like protein